VRRWGERIFQYDSYQHTVYQHHLLLLRGLEACFRRPLVRRGHEPRLRVPRVLLPRCHRFRGQFWTYRFGGLLLLRRRDRSHSHSDHYDEHHEQQHLGHEQHNGCHVHVHSFFLNHAHAINFHCVYDHSLDIYKHHCLHSHAVSGLGSSHDRALGDRVARLHRDGIRLRLLRGPQPLRHGR